MSESKSVLDELSGEIVTVDDVNESVSTVISQERSDELSFDYIVGDVADDSESNGTRYFQLVNEDAGIQCLAFSRVRNSLPEFEEGDRVAVRGKLTFYEQRANCSIYVDSVIPVGESEYHAEIRRVKKKLGEEGVFDEDAKHVVPDYPSRIGVVTSKGSDAEEDAVTSIHDEHPDVSLYLRDTSVQGMSALEELCESIAYFDSRDDIDVIVVTRGGGSEQDLHVFNSEGVARMIYDVDTPVVTAIGHENDTPIVDRVADSRAMTPTEVGSVVVNNKQQLVDRINRLHDSIALGYSNVVRDSLDGFETELQTAFASTTEARIQSLSNRLESGYTARCDARLTELENSLDATYELFVTEKQHEEETDELRSKTTIYKTAAVVLAVLFLLTLLVVFVL
jgi:exodeoxyribonuclease VII large subunit